MKILSIKANNRRKCFEVRPRGKIFAFPFVKCLPQPSPKDPVVRVSVDPELGREAFTFVLKSGQEGSVHIEQVLEFNRDPTYLRDLIAYQLTLEARRCLAESGLSKREAIRRLHTSAPQLYRLLDPARGKKSVDQLLRLLSVLGQEVQVNVYAKSA
jgi:predicted XRE-type DNA-binding protein